MPPLPLAMAPKPKPSGFGGYNPAAINAILAHARRAVPNNPALFVATALVESNLNPRAMGDGGNSFGLFQLNRRGRLATAGLTPDQAYDPDTNARVSADEFRTFYDRGARGPSLAARAQRPADPAGYQAKIKAALPQARQLLGQGAPSGASPSGAGVAAAAPGGGQLTPASMRALQAYLKTTEAQVLAGKTPTGPEQIMGRLQFTEPAVPDDAGMPTGPRHPGVELLGNPGSWVRGGGPEAHGTRALGNWQSDNAYDIMGKAGQAVPTPVAGKVIKISGQPGGDPGFAGYGITVQTSQGQLFFKHLGTARVKVGDSIRPGQVIGTLDAKTAGGPHIHLGGENRGFLDSLYKWYVG